ncbi:MAG: hypothetical protein P4L61_00870 [Candidatus Pacebacteria bacterium]|nr:hypothetical protein [Candidatus Paceibacterota bacterium]
MHRSRLSNSQSRNNRLDFSVTCGRILTRLMGNTEGNEAVQNSRASTIGTAIVAVGILAAFVLLLASIVKPH